MLDSFAKIIGNKNFSSPILKKVSASLTVETANNLLAQMFGPEIKDHANAAYIKQGALYIACLSGAAAQEIKLHEADLLNLLHERVSNAQIAKIRYIL
ncbi:MAG: DUF721 domain-containing protein [Candidatus Magasanikbacteria bacterium]|nr:DUF721 domain-containing protein [Candidatus Magasanikbacteria bacterium]